MRSKILFNFLHFKAKFVNTLTKSNLNDEILLNLQENIKTIN